MERRPSTPGVILKEEFMDRYKLSAVDMARESHIDQSTLSRIINGKVALTMVNAMKLGRLFGNTADFWLNLQREVDRHDALADAETKKKILEVKPFSEGR